MSQFSSEDEIQDIVNLTISLENIDLNNPRERLKRYLHND